jgi:hypothetical protein
VEAGQGVIVTSDSPGGVLVVWANATVTLGEADALDSGLYVGGITSKSNAATTLASGLGDDAEVDAADPSKVTLKDDLAIPGSGSVTVPYGVTLAVAATKKITVAATGAFTVNGAIDLGAGAEIDVTGTYTLGNGVTGTNNGTVTVKTGGTITNGTGVNIGGSGTNVVEVNGVVYFNGESTPTIGGSSTSDVLFALIGGTFTYNNNGYILNGTATLKDKTSGAGAADVFFNKGGTSLTIKKDAVLTLEPYAVFVLGGGFETYADIPLKGDLSGSGTNAPKIIMQSGSNAWYSTSSIYHYFYANNYSGVAGSGLGVIPQATYEWEANVNSLGFAGWKAGI